MQEVKDEGETESNILGGIDGDKWQTPPSDGQKSLGDGEDTLNNDDDDPIWQQSQVSSTRSSVWYQAGKTAASTSCTV